MATYTLRPSAQASTGRYGANVVGGTDEAAVMRDNSDATYVQTLAGPSSVTVELDNPTIPSNEVVKQVRARVRLSAPGGSIAFRVELRDSAWNTTLAPDTYSAQADSFTTVTGGWKTSAPDGGPWTSSKVTNLLLRLYDSGTGTTKPRLAEAWVDVETTRIPVATMTAPTGTITDTAAPLVTGTYSDADGDVQDASQVKVFTQAQYSAGSFNVDTSAALIDSGVMTGQQGISYQLPALANGTYRAYGRVRNDNMPGGHWSAWVYTQFTVSTATPNAPVVAATADSPNARMALTLQALDNLLTADESDFEAGIGSWTGTLNASFTRAAVGFASSGGYVGQVTATAAGRMDIATAGGANGKPVVPGKSYRALSSVRAATAGVLAYLYVYWYRSDGTASTVQPSVMSSAMGSNVNTWATLAVNVVAPSDAAFAQLVVSFQSPAGAGVVHYVDKAALVPQVTSTPWVRGPVPGTVRTFEVQRTVDGGATWVDVPRTLPLSVTAAPYSDAAGQVVAAYDYEALRAVEVQYRVRVRWELPTGPVFVSEWSALSLTQTLSPTSWWLKSLTDDTHNVTLTVTWDSFSEDEPIDVAEFEPLDADGTITVFGRTRGKRLSMDLRFVGEDQWTAFNELRRRREVLLLQDTNGRQWYVGGMGKGRNATERRWNGVIERRLSVSVTEATP